MHRIFSAPTRAAVRAFQESCVQDAATYLRADLRPLVSRVSPVPILEAGPHGRHVVRCDLSLVRGVGSLTHDPPLVTRTSMRRQALSGRTAPWHVCANQPLATSFPLSDCTKPHLIEAAYHGIFLQLVNDHYPRGAPDDVARGDAVCRHAVSTRPDAHDLSVHSHWISRSDWESQQRPPTLFGVCWFFRTDGRDLPGRR